MRLLRPQPHGWPTQISGAPFNRALSRAALIKLGLGPNHDHLLNPESARTSTPETSATSEASTPAAKGPAVPVSQPQR